MKATRQQRLFRSPYTYLTFKRLVTFIPRRIVKYLAKPYPHGDEIIRKYCEGSVIDIGCGPGVTIRRLTSILNRDTFILGLDITPEMISYAKSKHHQGDYIVSDCTELPFTPHQFSLALFVDVLHHIPTQYREKALKEAAYVAKKLLVWETMNSDNSLIRAMKDSWWKVVDGKTKQHRYMTRKEWKRIFIKAGFRIVEEHYSKPIRQFALFVLERSLARAIVRSD